MKADSALITWLLEVSTVSRYRISEDTGITEMTLSRLANGVSKMENITLGTAAALTDFAEKKMEEDTRMKFTGIKKAVGDYNNWGGHAEIMLNTDTLEIWCNAYPSANEWIEYDGDPVVRLERKASVHMDENWDKTSMKVIQGKAERLIRA